MRNFEYVESMGINYSQLQAQEEKGGKGWRITANVDAVKWDSDGNFRKDETIYELGRIDKGYAKEGGAQAILRWLDKESDRAKETPKESEVTKALDQSEQWLSDAITDYAMEGDTEAVAALGTAYRAVHNAGKQERRVKRAKTLAGKYNIEVLVAASCNIAGRDLSHDVKSGLIDIAKSQYEERKMEIRSI